MRTRVKYIVPVLLVVAVICGWFFWPPVKRVVVKRFPKPTAAMVHSASTAPKGIYTASAFTNNASVKTNHFAYRISNTSKSIGELTRNRNAILLENALIDTSLKLDLKIPSQLKSKGDPGAYIVQAKNPINVVFRSLILGAGGNIISYIPNNAYLVQISSGSVEALAANPQVQAVIPYEPYYKVQSSILGLAVDQKPLPPGMYLTLGIYGDSVNNAIAQIQQLGGQVLSQDTSPFGAVLHVKAPTDWIPLANLSIVGWVESSHLRKSANDLSRVALGVSTDTVTNVDYMGLYGSNIVVQVNDSGIDTNHPDFYLTGTAESGQGAPPTRIIADSMNSMIDYDGHGTHVGGIIAGNGAMSYTMTNIPQGSVTNADFRGKAPMAWLYSVGFLGSNDVDESDSYLQTVGISATNVLISNNSWVNDGDMEYDLSAASYDAAVRDALPLVTGPQPEVIVFAAGNDGSGDDDGGSGNADSIDSPGTAKDVITVGAVEQPRGITNIVTALDGTSNDIWYVQTDSGSQVAGYSSRGNVGIGVEGTFGRFKPDVVAPGTFVVSTRSTTWDQGAYFNPTNYEDYYATEQVVDTNGLNYYIFPFVVQSNTVAVNIQLTANELSPVPFPTNLPIYLSLTNFPDPTDSTTYDFVTTKDGVTIPPDGPANYLNSIINNFGGFNFGVGDSVTNPVNYDMLMQVITTNELGNQLQVLSNLDQSIGPWYRYETGTSMSAASVSGVLALMEDFFVNQRNPSFPTNPSPALMKALLINGARPTGFYNLQVDNPINYEGWGLVNLPNSIPLSFTNTAVSFTNSFYFIDQSPTNALATGDSRVYQISLSAVAQQLPLRLTLAWTDPPGNPVAAIKLVNNLELIVTNTDIPTNPVVYYGNDIGANAYYNTPESPTNPTPNVDVINNIQNIFLPAGSGTNFTIVISGAAVNVNAVTTQTNNAFGNYAPNIVQDFAFVATCGDGSNTNGFSLTANPPVSNPTNDQLITIITTTNGAPLMNQFVGANSPVLNTNTASFNPGSPYATNAVATLGMPDQWHFYIVTNYGTVANVTNAAFVTFLPETASIPREGVFADSDANSTRPEADIDLYVTTDSNLLNLSSNTIANCINGPQVGMSQPAGVTGVFNGSSLSRGGSEFVVDTNSTPGQIYYVGVKSEDQTAAQYGFLAEFSSTPFSQLNSNGDESVTFYPYPVNIPSGDAVHPGFTNSIGLAIYPINVDRVVVTNILTQQNIGDLVISLNHPTVATGNNSVILLNHDSPNAAGTYTNIYDDSGRGDDTNSQTSDGPGSLGTFSTQQGNGIWEIHVSDDVPGFAGSLASSMFIQKHQDLTKMPFITVSIPPHSWFYDYVVVPVGYTNLDVFAVDENPNPPNYLTLAVNPGSPPTLTNSLVSVLLTNVSLSPHGLSNSVSIGPPLVPGIYWVGVYNPDNTAHTVEIGAILSFNASAILTVDYTGGPVPLKDDAVTYSYINVTNKDAIQEFQVGLRVDHPRISDLAFTLIDPNDNRYLLMENRGEQSTEGCGATIIQTNQVSATASGSYEPSTNYINVGELSGTFPITYNFYTVPDEMTVYYGTNVFNAGTLLYDTGLTNNPPNPVGPPSPQNTLPETFSVTFPPAGLAPTSTYLTIIMNQFGNPASTNGGGDDWTYTAGGVLTNILYFTLTEDTNFTTTPVKYAPPPFVPGLVTNSVITTNLTSMEGTNASLSTFDSVAASDYLTGQNVDGWNVTSNQTTVVSDPANANSGSQFLALATGTISRTLPTVPGATNVLTFMSRGPGIAAWWRGESNVLDSAGANNGTLSATGSGYAPGEVGNAFNFDGSSGFVQIPNASAIEPANITIDTWVWLNPALPANNGNEQIIFKQNTWSYDFEGYSLIKATINNGITTSDHFQFCISRFGTQIIINSLTVAQRGVWYHLAATYDGNQSVLYVNGVPQVTAIAGFPLDYGSEPVYIGSSQTYSPYLNYFGGKIDELSIYNRPLSHSEVKAIANAGTAGKFDPAYFPPQNLAEAQISLPGVTNFTVLGTNAIWQTNTLTFVSTGSSTTLNISGIAPGMLLDSFSLTSAVAVTNMTTNAVVTANNLYYQPEVSLDPLIGTPANGSGDLGTTGVWTLEVLDNRAGAYVPSSPPVLDSWELEFEFANTNFTEPIVPINITNGPVTNTLPAGATQWYLVTAPTNAILATNSLLFSTLPLNMWWSTNVPPTTTNLTDVEMLGSSVGPAAVIIGTNPVTSPFPPAFFTPGGTNIAGGTYYLGFQNTNTTTLTYAFDVTFDLQLAPPYIITTPATAITPTTAILNADVVPNGLPTGVYFEYGTSTNPYAFVTTNVFLNNNLNLGQTVAIEVTNLLPGTLYHFQAVGTNVDGTNYGGDLTFVTPLIPPFAFTMPATLENGPSAQLNGMATPNGTQAVAWFEWGSSSAYGVQTPAVNVGTNFSVVYVTTNITGLFTNQPYHYRLDVSNSAGVVYGYDHVFAQANVVAWGADGNGQTVPLPTGLTNLVIGLGAGLDFSLALNYNALPVAWGDGNSGQTNVPAYATNVVEVAGGDNSCIALRGDGSVVAWGSDNFFQTNIPPTLTNAVEAKSGTYHCLALRADGSVVSWGANFTGQTNVPASASNVVEVAGGLFHSIALLNNGTVIGWGFDGNGQTNVPANATNVVAIAAGDNFNLALRSDGTVVGWGENQDGEINTTGYTNVLAISAGGSHSLALRNDGTVYAWGDNSSLETSPLPVGLTNVVAIASGENHNLALSSIYGLNVTNAPPFWTNNVNGSTNSMLETTTLVVTNTAVDTNFPPLTLNYSLLNGPSWASINPLNGIITFTPNITVGPSTNVITTVVVNNGHPPLSATNSFTLIVIDTNTTPFFPATAPTNYIIVAGGTFTITNTASQTNVPVSPLTYSLLTGPSDATINATNGLITWPTSPSEIGITTNFVTVVTDFDQYALPGNQQLSATNTFTVTVSATNTGPYWPTIPIPNQTAGVTNLFTLTVWAADTNLPPPHLTYSLGNAPAGMTITTVGTNGVINWTPTLLQGPATYSNVLVIVDDNVLPTPLTATNMFNITVTNSKVVTANGPFYIKSIIETNITGTNGFLLTWFAPSNDLFVVQWENTLIPTNWQSFSNIVSYNTSVVVTSPTNAQFNFFDNGTQTGGFGPTRFYRLLLLQTTTNTLTLPNQTNFTVNVSATVMVTNIAVDSSPSAIVTYSLLNPPPGAGITNGVITWPNATPQGLAARFITIASDNSAPPVTTSNQFTVFIAPFPAITNVTVTTTNVTLSWPAPTNDQFNVHWTTNLAPPVIWATFPGTITSTTGVFSFTDTNALNLSVMRFYQLILLP